MRADQALVDKYGLHGYNMRLRLGIFGPFGNRRFVDRTTTEKKLKEQQDLSSRKKQTRRAT